MANELQPAQQPYVGPRPFEQADQALFFGRDREVSELLSLVIAHDLVLLYAESGAGKSSLLNAGLIPQLEQEKAKVLPIGRVRGVIPESVNPKAIANIYVFNTLLSWAKKEADPAQLLNLSIADYLQRVEYRIAENGLRRPHVVIFDQFEELFTSYHERWRERKEFFQQVAEALEADPLLRIMFVIREDYVAQLDPYVSILPEKLRTRYRLERLQQDAALLAVKGPLKDTSRSFAPNVAEALVQELLKARIVTEFFGALQEVEGQYVEPVQLQVVCQRLWANLPVDVKVIGQDHWQRFGDVSRALAQFYEAAIQATVTRTNVDESTLRTWFGKTLITPMGTRGTVYRDEKKGETGGILNTAIDVLEDQHIIRAESWAGIRWYELTHDRFIEPILASNGEWFETWRQIHRNPLTDAAREWQRLNYDEGALFGGAQLDEAIAWAQQHAKEMDQSEQKFLDASVALRDRTIKQQAKNARVLGWLVAALVGALLVAVWGWWVVLEQRNTALTAQREAETAKATAQAGEAAALIAKETEAALRNTAEQAQATAVAAQQGALTERDTATSRRLAAQAMASLQSDPQLALLLGVEALAVTHTVEADSALRQALLESHTRVVLRGHTGEVNALAFSARGRWLATASDDKTVRVWEVETGKELALLPHKGEVLAVVFSLTEDRLTTVSRDGLAHFWVASTGEEMTRPDLEGMVGAAAFSDDGRLLASGGLDGVTRIWDIEQDKALALLSGHTARIKAIAFSPDGVKIATASLDGTARLWEAATGKEIALLAGHATGVNALVFSPDGRLLATAGADGTAHLWDALTGSERRVLRSHDNSVTVVAFSPDGQRLATGSVDHQVKLWDVATGEPLITLSGHNDAVNAISFSPDGLLLATASADGSARLWNAVTGKLQTTLQGHTGSVGVVLFSRNGDLLATAGADGTARIWAATESEAQDVLRGHEGAIYGVAFNPQGNLLATSSDDFTIRLWDMAVTGAEADQDRLSMTLKGDAPFFSRVAFNHDGTLLAAGDRKGAIHMWDVAKAPNRDQDAQAVTLNGHKGFVFGVAFSPDGKFLATGSEDGTARLWNIKKVRETGGDAEVATLSVCSLPVYGVAFSLDGSLLATSCAEGTIRLWEVAAVVQTARPKALAVLETPSNTVVDVAFNHDLLAAGSGDGTVYLWDYGRVLKTGITEPSAALRGHSDLVIGVAFNADGSLLATASTDGTTRLWDVQSASRTGGRIAEITVQRGYEGGVYSVAFSPSGSLLAAGGGDRNVRLWTVGMQDLLVLACQRAVRNLTQSEWEQSNRDQPYRKTCPDIPVDSSVIETMKAKAQAEIRQGQVEVALLILRQAKELDPSLTLTPEAEAASLLVARGRELASQGEVHEVLPVLRQAKELDPRVEVGRALAECGREVASQGQVDGALTLLRQAMRLHRSLRVAPEVEVAGLLVRRGRELAGQGKVDEALAALRRARELDPTLEERQSLQMARLYHEVCSQASGQNNLTPVVPDLCQRAVTLAVATDDAYLNFSLCRQGMVVRLAEMVEPACERAAELARPLAFGQSVTGTLSAGSGDLWTFKNPALQVVTIAMNQSQGQLDAYLTLIGPDGSVLARDGSSGGGGTARLGDLALYETGVYTVVAHGLGDGAGSYTLSLKRETRSKPELAGLLVRRGRELAGQGQVHEALAALRRARELDPTLEERQSLQMARLYHEVCSQASGQNNLTPVVPDLCQRAVTLAVATDDAYLNFSLCRQGMVVRLAEMVEPACERAAELARPLAFGQSVTGTLSAGSGDLWTFKNPALQVVTIAMNQSQGQLDAYLTLIGPDGSVLARDGSSGGGGTARLGDLALYETGVYTVVAHGLGDGAGSYTLSLKRETRSKPELAGLLVRRGRELAGQGQVHEALAIFAEALILDPSLDVKPVQEAKEIAATVLIAQANEQVRAGQTAGAVATLEEAQAIAREINSGALHFAICRLQTSKELAEVAATACEALAAQTPLIEPGLPVTGAVRSALGDPWKLEITSSSRVTITLSTAENSELDPYLMLFDAGFRLIAEHDDIERAVIKDSVLYDVALVDPGLYWIGAGRCCPDNDQGSTGVYVLEVTLRKEE
ncbi:MAG: hypothetical protein KJ077_19655 [Anaerolineae bacterium]|nr:hypothetical protein [Anaerolineae bacterium]